MKLREVTTFFFEMGKNNMNTANLRPIKGPITKYCDLILPLLQKKVKFILLDSKNRKTADIIAAQLRRYFKKNNIQARPTTCKQENYFKIYILGDY